MKIVDLEEMNALEKQSFEEYGFTESLVIENVGLKAAHFLEQNYLNKNNFGEIVFLIGSGNNGADGMAIARHIHHLGYLVRAFMVYPDIIAEGSELEKQIHMAKKYGVKISDVKSVDSLASYLTQTQSEYFIVDVIFGTGVRLPLSNYLFEIVNLINKYATMVVAVDIPSGVCGETGQVSSSAIQADLTLAVGLPKLGHFLYEGPKFCGELSVLDVGFSNKLLGGGDKFLIDEQYVLRGYKNRDNFSHKYKFGHTLVLGGSQGLTGALIMAAQSAHATGVGVVTAVTWQTNYGELVTRIDPDIITGMLPRGNDQLAFSLDNLEKYNSVVIGPGLGRTEEARNIILEVLNNCAHPVVLDADALMVLSYEKDKEILRSRKAPTILTPHYAEFARFIGADWEEVKKTPLKYIKKFVDQTNSALLLKGHCSYLAFPNGTLAVNYSPNSGLSKGGSGDALAGILGGVLAQVDREHSWDFTSNLSFKNQELSEAICQGVYLHSEAGRHAAEANGARGMKASEISNYLQQVYADLDAKTSTDLSCQRNFGENS